MRPLRDPTFRALATAAILIAVWFVAGPVPNRIVEHQAWLRHGWHGCADVVVVGDSSVAFGLHPELVERELHGEYRVANFGYLGISLLADGYLDGAEATLDPATPDRTLVLAVTPDDVSTAGGNRYRGEARDIAETDRKPHTALDWSDELDLRLRPRGLCWFLWGACTLGSQRAIGLDGQLYLSREPSDETFDIPATLEETSVQPYYRAADLDRLAAAVAAMRGRGVHVVAYVERLASPLEPIYAAAGFDPGAYERRLRAAGADVIAYPGDLTTYDGSHLDAPSQARWSSELGRALAARLPRRAAAGSRCAWPTP